MKKGFTSLEIMIVITILVICFVAIIGAANKTKNAQAEIQTIQTQRFDTALAMCETFNTATKVCLLCRGQGIDLECVDIETVIDPQ